MNVRHAAEHKQGTFSVFLYQACEPANTGFTVTDNSTAPNRIGLIAGQGDFPLLIARSAISTGTEVVALCIKEFASPELETIATRSHWLELGQLQVAIDTLKKENVSHLTMAGRVPHNSIFQYRHFDWRAMKLLARAAGKRADELLNTVCAEFLKEGIQVIDSSMFLKSLMPGPGLLTSRPPTATEQRDIDFALPLVQALAGLDIGQTIVVKDSSVIAVEGMEGTDHCIRRAGELAGSGTVVVKTAKPKQDLRFDIPVIGPGTIKSMKSAGSTALALSAGKSLIFHKDEVIELAEEAGICITIFETSTNE